MERMSLHPLKHRATLRHRRIALRSQNNNPGHIHYTDQQTTAEEDKFDSLAQMGRTLAHQLNNMLTTILANTQLASLMIDNEEVKSHLDVVEEATGDAGIMVRKFQESIYKLAKPPA